MHAVASAGIRFISRRPSPIIFTEASDAALQALRQELKAAQVILPPAAKLELNPGKDTLIVDYPVKDQEAVEAAEAFLVHSGWSAGNPKNNGFLGDAKALRQFTEAVDQQRKKVIEEGNAAAQALKELNIVDNDPFNPSTPVTATQTQALELAVIEKRDQVNLLKAEVAEIEKFPPEKLLQALPAPKSEDPLAKKQYRETVSNALSSVREAEAAKLKTALEELEASEQSLKAATENPASYKQKVFDYVNAKTVYLEDKRILDNMNLQYAAELAKYRAKQEAPPKSGK